MTAPSEELMREAWRLAIDIHKGGVADSAQVIALALQSTAEKARAEERERYSRQKVLSKIARWAYDRGLELEIWEGEALVDAIMAEKETGS